MGLVFLVLLICGFVAYLLWISSRSEDIATEPPPTEEELLQARLDLHRIDRGVDLALSKQETRREAERTKLAIAEALDDERR